MDNDYERRLTETEARSKSNTKRLDKLEGLTDSINRLAVSVERMATKQADMATTMDKLDGKVSALEAKPAKRWESIVDKVLMVVAAAVVGFALAKIGLG